MKKHSIRDGGWQVEVKYFDDYVIKTPRDREEVRKRIYNHFKSSDKLDKLEETTDKIISDWNESLEIIKKGNIPLEIFANLEFLDNGSIKQTKVTVLEDIFNELIENKDLEKAKNLVDKVIDFMISLWKYGIHEKTFKFYTEFGLLNNKIVLIDIGEITDNIEGVKKQIEFKKPKLQGIRRYYNDEILDYFNEQLFKKMNLETLKKNWGEMLK